MKQCTTRQLLKINTPKSCLKDLKKTNKITVKIIQAPKRTK